MTYFLAALRDGDRLVYMSTAGRWCVPAAFTAKGSKLRMQRYRYAQSAIGIASLFADRAGCGWRVEMITPSAST